MTRASKGSRRQGVTVAVSGDQIERVRALVERHKDMRTAIDLALADLGRGRAAEAYRTLRKIRFSDREKIK